MSQIEAQYDKIAHRYDSLSRLPDIVGFRDRHYHDVAVDMLQARPGDHVVVIGCGTGIDLQRLRDAVGPDGHIFGVDISSGMLEQARRKVDAAGWENVDLWHGDVFDFAWPERVDGVLASFTLKFQPRYAAVIQSASDHLRIGGHFAMADFQLAPVLRPLASRLLRTFAHDSETLARRPDHAVEEIFGKANVERRNFWFGGAYAMAAKKVAESAS